MDEAIAALGGERYLQTNLRSGTGHLYSFNSAGELNDPGTVFWVWYRFPADERIELTKKRDIAYVYQGGQGWEITYKGAAPVLSRQMVEYTNLSAHSLDVILKTWAQAPNTLMLDQGLSSFDQAQIESVFFTTSSGDTATVDFSVTTHLPVRVHWRREDPETGGHYEESAIYGDWAAVGGIQTPFSLDHFTGDQRTDQRYFTTISYAPFPASIFAPKAIKH